MSRNDREFRLQCFLARWLDACVPGLTWSAFPAGELRTKATGGRLKASGLKAGWPDLIAAVPPSGRLLALELKAEGGRQSPEQKAVQADLERSGAAYHVVRGLDDLKAVLAAHGIPHREREAA